MSTAEKYLKKGNEYYDKQNYKQALDCFQKAIELDPSFAEVYINIGNIYFLQNNDDKAIEYLKKGIELNPNDANVNYIMGLAYCDKQDYDTGITYLQKAIKLNPIHADSHFFLGMAHGRKGNHNQAIECFKKAIELNPNSNNPMYATAYNTVGIMYADKQEHDKALMFFKKAIELQPDFEIAYNNVAKIFFDERDYDNAFKYLQKAAELNPNSFYIFRYNDIGLAFDSVQDYDRAIKCYQKAIELSHYITYKDSNIVINDEALFTNIGNAYRGKKDYDMAIEYSQKAITLNPDYPNAYYNMGLTYMQKEDYDKTIENYQKAIDKKHDESAHIYNEMGIIYHYKHDYKKAIEFYNKAIEINSEYADAYHNMGLAYGQKEDYINQITCFQKAMELNYPDPIRALYNIAHIYSKIQDYDKAIESLQKTLILNPDLAFIYCAMGDAYNNKLDFDNAIKYYMKSVEYFLKEDKHPTFNGEDNEEDYVEEIYKSIGYIHEKRGDLKKACKFYKKSGIKDILEMLIHFDKDNRQKVIEQNILNDLLNDDNHFKSTVANVKDEKKYKIAYIQSIYIIGLLYIDDNKEKIVAHYREKDLLKRMLFKEGKKEASKFRLNTISNTDSNDDTEGIVLNGYLFGNETIIDDNKKNQYQAFVASFTFNHDSLTQFRLYGKDNYKECTGVSIVFNDSFFEESAKLATSSQNKFIYRDMTEWASKNTPELLKSFEHLKTSEKPYVKIIGKLGSKEDKCALFRCIYIYPKTNKVISLGCKENLLFYREGNISEGKEYNIKMENLIENVSDELDKLRKQIKGLDNYTVSQLLINLRYLTKNSAFIDERECRIVKIADTYDKVKVKQYENKEKKYIEYMEIGQHIKEIYFGPLAAEMDVIQNRLLSEGLKIECKKSENPFVNR